MVKPMLQSKQSFLVQNLFDEAVSLFLVLSKFLESSFETNSRFVLGLGSLENKMLAISFRHFR
jgi:hypothetical protein